MFTEPLARLSGTGAAVLDLATAPHGVDRYVEQLLPTWSSTEVRGRIVDVDRSADGSVVLTIEANRRWPGFRAGQHTQLTVEIDGRRHTRSYSMCSAAGTDRRFQLGIRAHPEGLVSRHLVAHARTGTVVGLTPPAGTFHLPDQRPDALLLISGGSGITPVLSMLRTLAADEHEGPVTFVHYNRHCGAMIAADEIRAIADALPGVRLLTGFDLEPDAGELTGLFDASHLESAHPRWRDAEAYVCGPAPLMDAVRSEYERAGALERFHQEAFTPPVLDAGPTGGIVRFTASGTDATNDGRPLLDQAEAAGLAPRHGCRMGVCHTCTRTLHSGTVRNAITGVVTSDPGVEIQVCVNVPVGDVDIDL